MLARQTLVGREQDDAVQLRPPARLAEIVQVLADVTVHEQRLPAAGRHPESQLVEVVHGEERELFARDYVPVVGIHGHVQRRHQALAVAEIAVQVHFRHQQPQILEIEGIQRLALQVAVAGDVLPVPDDVTVVFAQLIVRKSALFRQPGDKLRDILRAAVLGPAFEFRRVEHVGNPLELRNAELCQCPADQHQFFREVSRHYFLSFGLAPDSFFTASSSA